MAQQHHSPMFTPTENVCLSIHLRSALTQKKCTFYFCDDAMVRLKLIYIQIQSLFKKHSSMRSSHRTSSYYVHQHSAMFLLFSPQSTSPTDG